ncbi:MAG TPA: GDP-L-fucose synthase [Ferruginibacter sp.]|jgi:GDP-L-fucose synthase|nr:GDP-L-fucose synthase [Bacteroidota bacterium]MCC6692953.1 GDP-L-fucose synthase [Chitinophagaceae bacterium]HMT96828.1 GDP-L-fucose synthase [Ferruginibacter sp.]
MNKSDKIFIAGHNGLVGSAIVRALQTKGFHQLIYQRSTELDLRNQQQVNDFFALKKPAFVFLCAGKVGGIVANNTYRADFLYDNLMIAANVMHAAFEHKVTKLQYLGSSCIYPKMASQPIKEESILTGPLEITNEPYALAKIAGIKLAQAYKDQYGANFISLMPTNMYGLKDNYHPQNSHVLPALIRRFHEAKTANAHEVVIWGTGSPLREFLFADDLAEACIFLMEQYNGREIINVGSGIEISIKALAELIQKVVGFDGKLIFDTTKPDGTPRKLMDNSKIQAMGWVPKVKLEEGIAIAYKDFLSHQSVLLGQ